MYYYIYFLYIKYEIYVNIEKFGTIHVGFIVTYSTFLQLLFFSLGIYCLYNKKCIVFLQYSLCFEILHLASIIN